MQLPTITLDFSLAQPLHRQLYQRLREAILQGQLPAGTRLPSTRTLADGLAVSRNTVLNAYAQLLAEGYVEGKVGAGTYVARSLPDELLQVIGRGEHTGASPQGLLGGQRSVSRRGEQLARTPVTMVPFGREQVRADAGPYLSFRPGQPDVSHFPFEVWSRLLQRCWNRPPRELLAYSDPAGYRPLREAIAAYVSAARAVRCTPDQVVVVSGSQQGLDLAARVLLDVGDTVWMEDPGYLGARGALLAAGARLTAVPVDNDGLDVLAGVARNPTARAAYVTPSHQYPLGVTMSLLRRRALLEWAQQTGAWIIEDDYDSEYRYAGRPLAALQGLDAGGSVIYLGTFSKVLFPSLRLGYLIVPPDLVDTFVAARALADRHSPTVEQAVLAEFMHEGHFTRHIRRMRALYGSRQAALIAAVRRELAGLLNIQQSEAGMHLVGWLPQGRSDEEACQRAAAYNIELPALSSYTLEPRERGGLVFGYTALTEEQITDGVRRLARAL